MTPSVARTTYDHRVKNNFQIVSSLLDLQAAHTKGGAGRESDQTRIRTMALIHQLLYERSDFSRIDLCEFLDDLGPFCA